MKTVEELEMENARLRTECAAAELRARDLARLARCKHCQHMEDCEGCLAQIPPCICALITSADTSIDRVRELLTLGVELAASTHGMQTVFGRGADIEDLNRGIQEIVGMALAGKEWPA